MKIERQSGPPIIVGKRIVLGQFVGAVCAWAFWIGETAWQWDIPAAMVTQATTILLGLAQLYVVNKYGVTT